MAYSKKPRFNLSFVLQETGLKADSIRAWERRYQLPQPARSGGGQRLYSEYDLQTLLWLLKRQKEGMRIGQAASYWQELIKDGTDPLESEEKSDIEPVLPLTTADNVSLEDLQSKWLEYCFLFDERGAKQILSQVFAQYPMHTACSELILPGLRKVGNLWAKGEITVQQEHFTSEIAARKLQALISAAPGPTHKQKILIGSPPGEHHTIVLLMMTLLLKNRGWQIIYLGGNVPQADLLNTVKMAEVDLAILSASRLVTSASLKDSINLLLASGTPAAYSGWIFSQSEKINEYIPGLYLGDDLSKAVNAVEGYLNNPGPVPTARSQEISKDHLIGIIRNNETQISKVVLDRMMVDYQEFQQGDILRANRDLFTDITAALHLGDIELILTNLDWISSLLTKRKSDSEILVKYLDIVADALGEIVGDEASPIISLFENFKQGESHKKS